MADKKVLDVCQLMYDAINYTLNCANGYQQGNYEVSFIYPENNIAYQKLLKARDSYKANMNKRSEELEELKARILKDSKSIEDPSTADYDYPEVDEYVTVAWIEKCFEDTQL